MRCFLYEVFRLLKYEGMVELVQKANMHDIVHSFRAVKKSFFQLLTEQSEKSGITGIQFYALKILRNEDQIGVTDLAEKMQLGASTVSGVVDRLVKAELVERNRSPIDRRSVTLVLTERGKEVHDTTNVRYSGILENILEELNEEEIFHMLNTHQQIIESLEKAREENQHEYSNE